MPADGQYKMATYRVTTTDASQTDEWVATGGEEVLDVIGFAVDGTVSNLSASFVLNASGTGATAGANPGNLGIETESTATLNVTLLYR
jgi:hypothetical protein